MKPKIESKWIKVGDINTHYLVGGEGSPLVVVGGGGAADAEKDWTSNLEPLAQHYRIYAPDMVGYGKSDKPRVDYTQRLFITFLEDFTATLGLEHISLIGHSLGGGISLAFTLNNPQKVEKLVLINVSGLSNDLTPWGKLLIGIIKMVAKLKKDETCQSLMIGGSNREWHEVFMDRLSEIEAPTLICWSEKDRYMSVKLAYQAHERLKKSQLHVFRGGAHAPHRTRAREFNQLVLDFLRQ